jgi:hypothetical protein
MITLAAIASCGSVHTNNSDILVKKESSSLARFLNVTVESTESETSISGTLEHKGPSRKKIPGHVEVVILTKDEELVNEVRAELERVSSQPRHAIFKVVIDQEVPSNGIVIVKHHASRLHE